MRLNRRIKTLLTLALYIGVTVGLYAFVAYLLEMEFGELEVLYSILIGCFAYLPRFIYDRKREK